jgi:hemolysin activation/secretion protein
VSEIYPNRRWRVVRIAAPAMTLAIMSSGAWPQQIQSAAGASPSTPATNAQNPLAPSGDLLTIPRVAERPLTAEESPRIKVTAFELAGAVAQPAVGLSLAGVQSILDKAVHDQPAEGYTIADLEAVSDKVTEYYRQKGLVVAKAFIPAQEVRDGKVTVRVLEGKLSAITVEGNKGYSAKTLLRPFEDLIGAPVAKEQIESALLTLTNYPGLNAFGVLSAGQDVGTTKLALRVQKEDRVDYDFGIDNAGSTLSGENRATLSMSFNNVFGQADLLRAYALYGFDTEDSNASGLYGGFKYETPVHDSRNFWYIGGATNSYDIGNVEESVALTKPKGDAFEAATGFRHAFSPSRVSSGNWGAEFQWKTSTFESNGDDLYEDTLSVLRTYVDLSLVDQRFRGVNQMSFAYSHGFPDFLGSLGDYDPTTGGASRTNATGKFDKLAFDLARMQRLTKGSSLLLHVRGQYSGDPLVSLEQISLTGPDAVRAFQVTERAGDVAFQNSDSSLADWGVVTTLEWIFSLPGLSEKPAFGNRTWGQVLQFSLFADYGHGELNDIVSNSIDKEFDASGWGGSIQFNVPDKVFMRVDVSKPFTNDNPDSEDVQAYFRFGVHF